MGTTFLTVLGTEPYSECEYYIGKDGKDSYCSRTHLVQEAILDIYKNTRQDVKFDRIVCLLTERAKAKNWYNSKTKEEVDAEKKVKEENRDTSIIGEEEVREGLKPRLERLCPGTPIEERNIPIGGEEDIYRIFEEMYDAMEQDDELYIDVTHGFRSIPMLFFPVINYARTLKNITVKAIYYGAFEAKKEGEIKVPIVDLIQYDEIIRWSFASEAFVKYGISSLIAKLVRERQIAQRGGLKSERNISKYIDELSSRIQTVRGRSDEENGISVSGLKLNQNINEWIENSKYPLLNPLLENIREAAAPFNSDDNVAIGLATVEWCIDKNMVQQGFTALEETIISYVCSIYGYKNNYDDKFRSAVGYIMTAKCKQKELKLRGLSEEVMEDCRKIYDEIDFNLCKLTEAVKELRNDLNHFGMRKQPKSNKSLTKLLNEYYERFKKFIRKNSPEILSETVETSEKNTNNQ